MHFSRQVLDKALAGRYTAACDYPALRRQAEDWAETRPLDGVRVLDATPAFLNTIPKYLALLAAGAELTVACGDYMPMDPAVPRCLIAAGIPVRTRPSDEGAFDVVLDCGGAHRALKSRWGVSELTRSGSHCYEEHRTAETAVFLADSGRIKKIETCLGTGEGCLRALKSFGYETVRDWRVALFGCGKVGRGVAYYFRQAGARVTGIDVERVPGCEILVSEQDRVLETIAAADLVVTATGRAGAAAPFAAALTASRALLANIGVEDEFGPLVPAARVLNGKQPINFHLDEPTRLRFIDPTLALHNEGALFLLRNGGKAGLFEPDEGLEKRILAGVLDAGIINEDIGKAGF